MFSHAPGQVNNRHIFKNYNNLPLFDDVSPTDAATLLKCMGARIKTYEKDVPIALEGDEAKVVGILMSGQLQIIKDDKMGDLTIISNILPGEMFGEVFACARVDSMPVSVFTLEESTVLLIDANKLMSSCCNGCEFHSKVIKNLLMIVAQKTLALNQRIEILSKRTTREKLIHYLGIEYDKKNKCHFTIPFNRQQLADYLCVERSALSAEMSRMKKDKIIDYNKNEFWLL